MICSQSSVEVSQDLSNDDFSLANNYSSGSPSETGQQMATMLGLANDDQNKENEVIMSDEVTIGDRRRDEAVLSMERELNEILTAMDKDSTTGMSVDDIGSGEEDNCKEGEKNDKEVEPLHLTPEPQPVPVNMGAIERHLKEFRAFLASSVDGIDFNAIREHYVLAQKNMSLLNDVLKQEQVRIKWKKSVCKEAERKGKIKEKDMARSELNVKRQRAIVDELQLEYDRMLELRMARRATRVEKQKSLNQEINNYCQTIRQLEREIFDTVMPMTELVQETRTSQTTDRIPKLKARIEELENKKEILIKENADLDRKLDQIRQENEALEKLELTATTNDCDQLLDNLKLLVMYN